MSTKFLPSSAQNRNSMIYYWFQIEYKKILYRVKSTPTMSTQKQNAKLLKKKKYVIDS